MKPSLPAIPEGRYYLRIEPESSSPMVNYHIQVYRDVPQWSFFFMALGVLCILPIFMIWRSSRFEPARWAESDSAWISFTRIPPVHGRGKLGRGVKRVRRIFMKTFFVVYGVAVLMFYVPLPNTADGA